MRNYFLCYGHFILGDYCYIGSEQKGKSIYIMKSAVIFKEYIWLVNTIYKAKKITLEEINSKWVTTEMSGGVEIARSTFNRHKDAIEEMFGIIIDCDRNDGYCYFIGNEEVLEEDSVQNWMLSTLAVNNIISESLSVHNRILLESIPSDGENLRLVIEAMKQNVRITAMYQKYSSAEAKKFVIEPYCVKLFHRRWYVLGRIADSDDFRTLSFDRIKSLTITGIKFEMDADFDAEQYFNDSFGIVNDDNTQVEKVVLRAFGMERFYMRDLPVHHSQKEIVTEADYSDFEYFLRPTLDFSGHLVSRGAYIKVLEPQWLAKEISRMHEDAIKLYEK